MFYSYYEDEYRKLSRYLDRRYIRVAVLLAISVAAYFGGRFYSRLAQESGFLLNVISNVGVFCLWEIGYTHFDRSDTAAERRRVARARDAVIHFE